jgi:hypothetical protein
MRSRLDPFRRDAHFTSHAAPIPRSLYEVSCALNQRAFNLQKKRPDACRTRPSLFCWLALYFGQPSCFMVSAGSGFGFFAAGGAG